MTEHIQSITNSPLINMLFHYGLAEGMPRIAEIIVNHAMLIERAQHLQADSYQRSPERTGYANGFKKKSLLTSMGKLDLQVTQVRNPENPFTNSILSIYRKTLALQCSDFQS
ncbi:MAG: transposase [Akkermansia sp.]